MKLRAEFGKTGYTNAINLAPVSVRIKQHPVDASCASPDYICKIHVPHVNCPTGLGANGFQCQFEDPAIRFCVTAATDFVRP